MAANEQNKFQDYLDSADVRPDRLDLRDRVYQPPLLTLPPRIPSEDFKESVQAYIDADMVRDQGEDGACTGFALTAVIDFLFWCAALSKEFGDDNIQQMVPPAGVQGPSLAAALVAPGGLAAMRSSAIATVQLKSAAVSPMMLFHLARFYDEFAGEEGRGSSLRGAMKAWHRHGVCAERFWPWPKTRFKGPEEGWAEDAATRPLGVYYRVNQESVVDMQAAINEVGAMMVSAYIHASWKDLLSPTYDRPCAFENLTHDNLPRIEWSPKTQRAGMHAFALVGYNDRGFIVQNSWGKEWGSGGFAVLGYDDWNANGADAWVAVLGVPINKNAKPQRVFIDSKGTGSRYRGAIKDGQVTIDADFWKRGKEMVVTNAAQPGDSPKSAWSVYESYEHAVILGSNGRATNRLLEEKNAGTAIYHIAQENPSAQFSKWHRNKDTATPKIAIYALSGLLPDREELPRMRVLGKCYEDNKVYPIFVGWRNGFLDPFLDLAGQQIMSMLPDNTGVMEMLLGDRDDRALYAWDQTLEAMFESDGGKPMWTQLKQDALLSAQKMRIHRRLAKGEKEDVPEQAALQLLAKNLNGLKKEWPNLEIHLVGHSGGTIALSHFLAALSREMARSPDKQPVKSCTFYAPACSLFIAKWRLRYYMQAKPIMDPTRFDVHVLSDTLEQTDRMGPYHKSFLYLVSNALEDWGPIPPTSGQTVPSGTPVLGMERASTGGYWHPATMGLVEEWKDLQKELSIPDATVWDNPKVRIAPKTTVPASHESFPDNVKLANETLLKITGKKTLIAPVKNLNWHGLGN